MSHAFPHLYVHCVWSTKYRAPILTDEIEELIYPSYRSICGDLKCGLINVNGTMDHVHLLVRLHRNVAISTLIKRIKGASSRAINNAGICVHYFQWQVGYSAFTVHHSDVERVSKYIQNQKEIHAKRAEAPSKFADDDIQPMN